MKNTKLVTLYFICLLGIMPIAASAQAYVPSADGTEVTDKKTGLIWRRCAEGMNWNGKTCAGVASTFTLKAALQFAATQAASTGVAWRLPNADEFSSIIDRNLTPTINSKAFPATPASSFWADSPKFGDFQYGWFISFDDGYIHNDINRGESYHVRLVRSGQ